MINSEKIPKIQRLKSEKAIQHIFAVGQSLFFYPIKVQFKLEESSTSAQKTNLQFGVSVSKKSFKKAVDRNLIKRRLREAFRKQKFVLEESLVIENKNLKCMIIYVAKEKIDYEILVTSISVLIKKINKKISSKLNIPTKED
ncbi:MAG: ribonuclease P protein component [Saprospiraceae bacterium]|nr:ribonuclease P protein component [Saprospiraceae bacterium]